MLKISILCNQCNKPIFPKDADDGTWVGNHSCADFYISLHTSDKEKSRTTEKQFHLCSSTCAQKYFTHWNKSPFVI